MKRLRIKLIAFLILTTMFFCSGCSCVIGGCTASKLASVNSGDNRDLTDRYDSAEEFCTYWYGPCEEIDSRKAYEDQEDSDTILHVMRDREFGFEYTVKSDGKEFFFGSDFSYYYIKEFVKQADLDDLTREYDLTYECAEPGYGGGPGVIIRTERELSKEENDKILSEIMAKLDQFDSERKVFNKKGDNNSAYLDLRSAPWEKEKKNNARFHVEVWYFGDNYKEQ